MRGYVVVAAKNAATAPAASALQHNPALSERPASTDSPPCAPLRSRFAPLILLASLRPPLLASGRVSSPQTWNRYAYVGNNPLKLIDPSGLDREYPREQDDDVREREQMRRYFEQQARAEAEAARMEAIRNGEAAPLDFVVSPTADEADAAQDSPFDPNQIKVETAYIEDFDIKGKVSLNNVTFQINN